jgi:hypothetical protein
MAAGGTTTPSWGILTEARPITAEEAMRRFGVSREELEKPTRDDPPASR